MPFMVAWPTGSRLGEKEYIGFVSPMGAPRVCVDPQQRSRRLGHKQMGGAL